MDGAVGDGPSVFLRAGVHRLDEEHGEAVGLLPFVVGVRVLLRFGAALLPTDRFVWAGVPHRELVLTVPDGTAPFLLEGEEVRADRGRGESFGRAAVVFREDQNGAS